MSMDPCVEQKMKALDCLKEWSNYLLVTTVAALGWVAQKDGPVRSGFVVWCLALSAALGVLTLAVIPIVAERIQPDTASIYDVRAPYRPLWMWGERRTITLKWVCWPQHALFIAGIIAYAALHAR